MFDVKIDSLVARVTLASPPVNALTREWGNALKAILDDLEGREDWLVLHFRSREKAFSAGANLKVLAERFELGTAGELLAAEAGFYQELFARIERMDRLSLAEIGGAAAGGGFEFALSCDLRIASDTARVGLPETALGLLPGAGGTQRLTRLCGRSTALRLIGGAELVSGTEALALGLVNWAVPAHELADKAAALTRRFASMSRLAVAEAKACIAAAADPDRDGYAEELAATARLIRADDTKRRIRAFLSERGGKAPTS